MDIVKHSIILLQMARNRVNGDSGSSKDLLDDCSDEENQSSMRKVFLFFIIFPGMDLYTAR